MGTGNKPACLQIAVCPQSKNERSDFNQVIASGIVNAVQELQRDGYLVSFLNAANDGVSCDEKFVKETLIFF